MALLDLLKDPSAYQFGSKGLDYPEGQGPLLGKRVHWDITNPKAEPELWNSWNAQIKGIDHSKGTTIDAYIRGGIRVNENRRLTDIERIKAFFQTVEGRQFIATQLLLQTQNPRPQKVYNGGINTLASIASAGVSNIRRGGLIPTLGDFNILGKNNGTYIGTKRKLIREDNYKLGNPGKKHIRNSKNYHVSLKDTIDIVNFTPIIKRSSALPNAGEKGKDFVPFKFKIFDTDSMENGEAKLLNQHPKVIVFRAYLDSISDDYSATHNSFKYNGRGEEFYTYNKFARKIQLSFKVAAQSRFEMKPIYQKLNFLAAQTAPHYSSQGRITTPYCKLTVGDWFQSLPGLITSVGLTWQKNYPWEIALDRFTKDDGSLDGKDQNMLILPHVLDVSLSYQPIHDFTPNNSETAPFIGINGDPARSPNWLEPNPIEEYLQVAKAIAPSIDEDPSSVDKKNIINDKDDNNDDDAAEDIDQITIARKDRKKKKWWKNINTNTLMGANQKLWNK